MLIDTSAFMGSHMYTLGRVRRAPPTAGCDIQALGRRPLPAWVSPACVHHALLSAWHGRVRFATAMVLSHLRSLKPHSAPLFWAANACLAGGHACLAAPAPSAQYGAYRQGSDGEVRPECHPVREVSVPGHGAQGHGVPERQVSGGQAEG